MFREVANDPGPGHNAKLLVLHLSLLGDAVDESIGLRILSVLGVLRVGKVQGDAESLATFCKERQESLPLLQIWTYNAGLIT